MGRMSNPIFRHHEHKEMWLQFEKDEIEFNSDRKKYKGISSRPENYSWYYRHKNKQVISKKTLAEIYEFKLKFESELNSVNKL